MQLSFASLHLCLLLLAAGVTAVPTPRYTREVSIVRRQDVSKEQTVTTKNSKTTPAGTVTEVCEVKLTPIKDDQGNDAVQVVKTCQLQMDMGDSQGESSSSGTTSADSSQSTDSSNSSASSSDSANSASATSSGSDSSSASGSASDSAATTTSGSASGSASASGASSTLDPKSQGINASIGSIAASQDTVSATGSAASASTTNSATSASVTDSASGSSSVSDAASTSNSAGAASDTASSASSSGTAANDSAPTNTTAPTQNFTIPGKQLSVLPIGLGVFAGISVIALIVVGLVTYERTKYRKAFRQRKLAESGASMGYGGMAQRA